VRFRCAVDAFDSGPAYTGGFPAWIGVLHSAQRTCCCQITAFTARLRWHEPALFTLGHYGRRCPIVETVECYRYAPPCPTVAIRCLAHLQTLMAIVQARDWRDCSNQAGCMHRAFPLNPQAHATWRCQRQGRTVSTAPSSNRRLWRSRSSASLLFAASRPFEVPHLWQKSLTANDATAIPLLVADMCCIQFMHALLQVLQNTSMLTQRTYSTSIH
jgi:hypothetical protein